MNHWKNRWAGAVIAGLALTCLMTACGTSGNNTANSSSAGAVSASGSSVASDSTSASRDVFAMDTYMTVKAYGANADQAVDDAENEINRLDKLLSTGNSDSEVAQINANGGGTLSSDGQ